MGKLLLNSSFKATESSSHKSSVFLDIPLLSHAIFISSKMSDKYRRICALMTPTRVASSTNIPSRRLSSLVRITLSMTGTTLGKY